MIHGCHSHSGLKIQLFLAHGRHNTKNIYSGTLCSCVCVCVCVCKRMLCIHTVIYHNILVSEVQVITGLEFVSALWVTVGDC